MTTARLRIGFTGCGIHATSDLLPVLREVPVELSAICDRDEERARRSARSFGAARWYTSHDRMLAEENLDAVMICVGRDAHADLVLAALEAGRAVFVEKPPARDLAEAERLLEKSRAADRPVMVAFMKRFAPGYQLAKAVTARPAFGPVTMFDAKLASGPNADLANLLLDYVVHVADLARHFGGPVQQVYATSRGAGEDMHGMVATLEFASGAIGTLAVSSAQSWKRRFEWLEVTGVGEFVTVEDHVDVRYYPRHDWQTIAMPSLRPEWAPWPLGGEGEAPPGQGCFWRPVTPYPHLYNQSHYLNGYLGEVEHFVRSILDGAQPRPDLRDGVAAMRILAALERSCRERRAQEVS